MSATSRTVTVTGQQLASDYDIVLAHEHLFVDLSSWLDTADPAYETLRDQPVSVETIEMVRGNPFACPDNVILDDDEDIRRELEPLRRHDALIIDVTPDFIGRDPSRLARMSAVTGIDIVTGCGPYIQAAWPDELNSWGVEDFADHILGRFEETVPPAVIGEIGTSAEISKDEKRSLTGAARAQRQLGGVPLYVHLDPWSPQAHEALNIIEATGGDVTRTVLCHLDVSASADITLARSLLHRGCYVAFDIWGDEDQYGRNAMPTDRARASATAELVESGFGDRLVHSQDVCTKSQLTKFGGPGYGHLAENLPHLLGEAGLSPADITRQMAGNAMALLTAGPN